MTAFICGLFAGALLMLMFLDIRGEICAGECNRSDKELLR